MWLDNKPIGKYQRYIRLEIVHVSLTPNVYSSARRGEDTFSTHRPKSIHLNSFGAAFNADQIPRAPHSRECHLFVQDDLIPPSLT